MTENEAKEQLESLLQYDLGLDEEIAVDMAIQALEEIQQYRAIGTVEEIQQKLKNMSLVIDTDRDLLNRYIAIGTIEEFKALKEKSVAKKVDVWANGEEHCPCCDKNLTTFWGFANCFDCGQKLDWSE